MSLYCIGDLQGCNLPFQRLLEAIDFSPSRDTLYLLGDLVNRGPDSLGVLRSLMALGDAAQCLLGNHDLHLLTLGYGLRQPGRSDTVQDILQAPDRRALLDWLRHCPMAMHQHGWLMVHAGVLPQWNVEQTMRLAAEVQTMLRGPDVQGFLGAMYGNLPSKWHEKLEGFERLRVIVNALTRLRVCTKEGVMGFGSGENASDTLDGLMPWFKVPGRATLDTPVAFGHWSTLAIDTGTGPASATSLRSNTLPLDTGCVWGGCLTAARLGPVPGAFDLIQVACDAAQKPKQKSKQTSRMTSDSGV